MLRKLSSVHWSWPCAAPPPALPTRQWSWRPRRVKHANDKYRNLAVAEAAQYGLFPDKDGITCIDMPGMGAMGIHYVNGEHRGRRLIDPLTPEALVYAPRHGACSWPPSSTSCSKPIGTRTTLAAVAVRPTVQLHAGREPLRPSGLLLPARVAVEAQPRRHVCDVEPQGELHPW